MAIKAEMTRENCTLITVLCSHTYPNTTMWMTTTNKYFKVVVGLIKNHKNQMPTIVENRILNTLLASTFEISWENRK